MENQWENVLNSNIWENYIETQISRDEDELKKYTVNNIIETVMNKNNWYWQVKLVHASGHGGQHINHGNSKAQLHFDINKFYNNFDLSDKSWQDFVRVFWEKNISHDQSTLVLENQETRYASKNRENVLNHLRSLLLELFKEEKERIKTEISEYQKEKDMHEKQMHSEKKKLRQKVDIYEE